MCLAVYSLQRNTEPNNPPFLETCQPFFRLRSPKSQLLLEVLGLREGSLFAGTSVATNPICLREQTQFQPVWTATVFSTYARFLFQNKGGKTLSKPGPKSVWLFQQLQPTLLLLPMPHLAQKTRLRFLRPGLPGTGERKARPGSRAPFRVGWARAGYIPWQMKVMF